MSFEEKKKYILDNYDSVFADFSLTREQKDQIVSAIVITRPAILEKIKTMSVDNSRKWLKHVIELEYNDLKKNFDYFYGSVNINRLSQEILNKWGSIIENKAKECGMNVNVFLDRLILFGNKFYGNNFAEDLLKENSKNSEAIKSLVDEIMLKGRFELGNLSKRLPSGSFDSEKIHQSLVNVVQGVVNQKAEQEAKQLHQSLANAVNGVVNQKAKEQEATRKINEPSFEDKSEELRKYSDFDDIDDDFDIDKEADSTSVLPVTARIGMRKKAPIGLISKFKEKWKDPKFKKKIIVGAIALATVGVATVVVVTQLLTNQSVDNVMLSSISNMAGNVLSGTGSESSLDVNSVSEIIPTNEVSSGVNSIDYGSIGIGDTIYSDAYSAVSNLDPKVANEFVGNVPMDVFDTVSGKYMNLTPEQLNNVEFMQNLMSDGNHSLLVGHGGEASGFINADGFKDLINSGRSR